MGLLLRSFLLKATNEQMQGTYTEIPEQQMQGSIPGISSTYNTSRGGTEVERWTHNPEVEGSNPSPATKPLIYYPVPKNIILGYN